jgi:uncharacterized protein YecT (DUF1311 family)
MGCAARLLAGLVVFISVDIAGAQTCPTGMSNDQCDRWRFERAERELASVVATALARIEEFAVPDTRQEAKAELEQAQQAWVRTRNADCQSESAFQWHRSARTREGNTAACLTRLTTGRIEELKRRYLLSQ